MHTVHVRVNDAATGKPTPCRVRFTDAEGRYYAPFGRLTEFAVNRCEEVGGNLQLGDKKYAYIDGTCEIRLPVGEIRVEISKGFEYRPLDQTIRLGPGKLALRFTLERWVNWRGVAWFSGDCWVRRMTPHAALLEGAAEDVAVVNLLAEEKQTVLDGALQAPTIPNILAFSGQRPALEAPGCLVVVNTVNEHPVLGRLALLNCHRIVFPLTFGGPDGSDDWTLADWCDQCHRKGGLVVGHDFFGHPADHHHGEVLADLILGKIDALDLNDGFDAPGRPVLQEWESLLNAGFRVPLVGGSGKLFNRDLLGGPRTYAHPQPGREFTYKDWTEAVRAGRTIVTNGPLLYLSANCVTSGSVLDFPAAPAGLRVIAEARSLFPFDRLEVICNGVVVAHADAAGNPWQAAVDRELTLSEPGWITARCVGEFAAQTSPVYFDINGQSPRPNAAAVAPFLAKLDAMLRWVAEEARCDDAQRQRLADIFRAARQELQRRSHNGERRGLPPPV